MDDATRLAEISALVRTVTKLPETTLVTAESTFTDDLGIDSLDLVALFLEVQDQYEITIDDDQIGSMRCVGDLLRLVNSGHGDSKAA